MSERTAALAARLREVCAGMPASVFMEVCGTHTQAVARYALRQLLPENVRLISGPGCPVCVTPDSDIGAALALTGRPEVTLCSFGDMLRVPVGENDSLLRRRGAGADVRVALSPLDALRAAREQPQRQIVWFAVGFETTAPHTAALVLRARTEGVRNLTVLCAHKTMPAALCALLGGARTVDGLLCPGHVAAVTGADAFRFVPERLGIPGAVAGFEPEEILAALLALAGLRRAGKAELRNMYPAVVRPEGNLRAQQLIGTVFEPCAARWRGLGEIADSGLRLRPEFADFDTRRRFSLPAGAETAEAPGCRCGEILRGAAGPCDCPLFGGACTPARPRGPCMVSAEGACAAEYRYGASC